MKDYERLKAQWIEIIEETTSSARMILSKIVADHSVTFADAFYAALLLDGTAKEFISPEAVSSRLHNSLQRWIRELLSTWEASSVPDLLAVQRHVGAVHSRQHIRLDLVLQGARNIKHSLLQVLKDSGASPETILEGAIAAVGLIDIAIEAMSAQFETDHEQESRTDEAYRAFAATMNTSLERERQRTALLNWENRFLQEIMTSNADVKLPRLSQSSFGLWLRHKAPAIFKDPKETGAVLEILNYVDHSLLPLCQREIHAGSASTEIRRLVRETNNSLQQIKHLTDMLFEQFIHLENGRDTLTQLLNRRYASTIIAREIALCRQENRQFAVLMIDIDYFKNINDSFGHDAGDRVLQHIANVFLSNVRSGDFVVRYGGEEFLVLCVEVDPQQALNIAEKLRVAVSQEKIPVPGNKHVQITVSVGVAAYDGHPDYMKIIDKADKALYQAKGNGRNCSVLSD